MTQKSQKIPKKFYCKSCYYKCSNKKDFNKHLLTAKHYYNTNNDAKIPKNPHIYSCECGKIYKYRQGLYSHKKKCSLINNTVIVQENLEEKPSIMDIISQNKDIVDLLILQNEELKRQNKEQSDTIRELIPKIGNNNNTTTNNNNNHIQLTSLFKRGLQRCT